MSVKSGILSLKVDENPSRASTVVIASGELAEKIPICASPFRRPFDSMLALTAPLADSSGSGRLVMQLYQ